MPVVFLTASDGAVEKLAGPTVGDDHMTKPFSLAELIARIRSVPDRTRDAGRALTR
ncbi:hypothetical protein OG897_03165 [Streptomyces sp. NBC_00237]|uniref:hypothetical protein n=1 Tax=Streptomyces sp. NBC_00237 TaxID=2975687 RepID=UPI002255F8CA|nr:hypothetical protein [Streptomyces sp. NBC_00237]MCX5200465.1 hypothetical protein [Streptomyces sp. NBC_00237]